MKNKLAIFDMDGTLFDTSYVNYYAYSEALYEYGIKIQYDYFRDYCNGRHYAEFIPKIMNSAEHLEKIHKHKKQCYASYLDKAIVNNHLFEIIKTIKNEYYIALVTTASRQNCSDILNKFGYYELFDILVTQEDITRTKPDPEGFFKAMTYFKIPANNTFIFEDSEVGIKAARATGATVFVVKQFGDNNDNII